MVYKLTVLTLLTTILSFYSCLGKSQFSKHQRSLQSVDYSANVKKFYNVMNLARSQPQKLIPFIDAGIKEFNGMVRKGITTSEGVSAWKELKTFLQNQKPLKKFKYSNGMAKACKDMVKVSGPVGHCDHTGPDGSTMTSRVNKYGDWQSTIGENLAFGDLDGMESVIQLMVDDGVSSRGHRENIFNSEFKVVGVSIGTHKKYRYMTCSDFAGGFTGSLEANPKYSPGKYTGSLKPKHVSLKPNPQKKPKNQQNTPKKNQNNNNNWKNSNSGGWKTSGGSSWSSSSSSSSGNWDDWRVRRQLIITKTSQNIIQKLRELKRDLKI